MEDKQAKLIKLDGLVLDKIISYLEYNQIENIKELTTAVQYLKANQVVEVQKKDNSDPLEKRKMKLAEAEKRRMGKVNDE